MRFEVYADLNRRLSAAERAGIAHALDLIVPGSGCVGEQRSSIEEVYFCIEADDEEQATSIAGQYMQQLLQDCRLNIECQIHLQAWD